MLFKIFHEVFKNTFFARAVLFFGVGWAFAKLTRPQRELHGWSFWDWELSKLAFGGAATTLTAWLIGIFIASIFIVRRDAKKRGELS